MASVKEEVKEEMESDIWLSNWANAENEEVKQEVDEKPNLSAIKLEVENDTLKPKQKKEDQNNNVLVKASRAKKSDEAIVTKKKSKKNIEGKTMFTKRDNCSKSGLVHKPNNTTIFQTALEKATHSDKIANLCEFQCPKCNKVFCTLDKLSTHCKKTKHAVLSRGFNKNYLIKIVTYNCKICCQKILCDIKNTSKPCKKSSN